MATPAQPDEVEVHNAQPHTTSQPHSRGAVAQHPPLDVDRDNPLPDPVKPDPVEPGPVEANPVELAEATWTELVEGAPVTLLFPVGSCEQHGPHLPFSTDTIVANSIARAAAQRLCASPQTTTEPTTSEPANGASGRVLVAPPVTITASGEHGDFPGTLSIGTTATTTALVELMRSADWAERRIIVNGHGGNLDAIHAAVKQSHRDGRTDVAAWSPKMPAGGMPASEMPARTMLPGGISVGDLGGDIHAGAIETSVMLHLRPDLVRVDQITQGTTDADLDALRRHGVRAVAPTGVLGAPDRADAEFGAQLFEEWVADLTTFVSRAPAP